MKKSKWKSKTHWVNAIVALAALVLPEEVSKQLSPANIAVIIALVNIILRATTKHELT